VELPGVTLAREEVTRTAAQYDLTLYMAETAAGLNAALEYNTALFDAGTMERLVERLRTLLEGIVSDPGMRISELPLLSGADLSDLERWNRTGMDYEREACLPELVRAQVERTPEAVAAEYGSERLSYRELELRAEALARKLAGWGVEPGVLVGVYMERSLEMLVALLGILKAGGAYVPLDPSYPKERVSYMLEDSGPTIVVTQQSLAPSLDGTVARVLSLDGLELSKSEGGATPLPAVRGEDLAYVIYTSGSTGRPKGVQITHRSLVNFLESMKREPGLGAEDVVLSVTTLSFDPSTLELYLPLLVGGRVVLVSREESSDGERLLSRLKESGATVMQATPSTWRLLLEAGWTGDRRLKLLCGGEALSRELAERLLERSSSLWNVYGPTETTVWSTVCQVVESTGTISIGRPIGNMRYYVLDRRGRRVPVGVAGELCIGGEGLAWGYKKRADLTAETFVPNPFDGGAGSRLYRSGDLGRFLPDGRLEWLSRLDHQVKVRGHRIELGEIESVLVRHPAVERAVVLAKGRPGEDYRLVGYLVAAGMEPTATELRKHLKAALPAYMVPGAFVFLDEFPLTPSGKVDRKALDRLESRRQADEDAYQPPRTPTEAFLADLWRELLSVERIGLRDNFFDLGGHSLLAMKVIARIEKGIGPRLNPRDIIYQSLEQLAADCDRRGRQPVVAASRELDGRSA
jgi:amino acid adenylation domain-containing protein